MRARGPWLDKDLKTEPGTAGEKKKVKPQFSARAVLQPLGLLLFLHNVICVSAQTRGLYPASLGRDRGIPVAAALPSVVTGSGKLGTGGA